MTYPSQMQTMRDFIKDEVVPRFITLGERQVAGEMLAVWSCCLCDQHTEYDTVRHYSPHTAKHTTYCKLGLVLSVVE